MTDQSRNVELVIRAKNLSKKTLGDLEKDIEGVNKALDRQVEAAKRGEGSMKDLDKSYGKLEDAMKGLLQQQAVIKNFEAQKARLVELQAALTATNARLDAHRTAMEGSTKTTKRQEAQLATYERQVVKASDAIDKQAVRLAATGKQAQELGVDLQDLVGSQDRVLAAGRRLSDGYDKQGAAVERFDYDMRNAKRAADEMAAATQFDDAARKAAELNKAGQYVAFWTQQLDKMDAEQRQAANSDSLNKLADNALAASRGYKTLGDASQRLIQNNRAVGQSLREIMDPAGIARTTLGGVEEEIRAMAAAAAAAKGPVTDYRAQVQALAASNKALSAQGSGIDAFQQQIVALRAARAEYVQNRTALQQYAQAVRQADVPTAEMTAELNRLKANMAASRQAFTDQAAAARLLRTDLAAAGIATNNLNDAQARLVTGARTNVSTMTTLNAAVEKYGTTVKKADDATGFFASNGRTTLSFVQRLRGEVLALAAAYVGLQGTIGLASGSLDASNNKQGLQNQLALAVGDDPKAIGAEYKYIRDQADRIGISFEEAAKGYGKFAAAAKLAGRDMKEIRYVAESFLEVGRVANLTSDDIGGVFKALEQIYSKGKIQAEELRGQLGDRLFGAFEIAAIALKDQFPNLDKAMKDGLVTSEQLVAIAEQYRKTVAVRLPTAMESLAANQARLNSAFFDFKVLIAESGFADQYEALIKRVSAFLRSDDGTKLAKDLSTAFGVIAQGLTFLLEHLDEVKLVLELAFGAKALALVAGFATVLTTTVIPALLTTQAELAATGVAGATAAGVIQKAFIALGVFLAAWQVSDYLAEQDWGIKAVYKYEQYVKAAFIQIEFAAKALGLSIQVAFENWMNFASNTVKNGRDKIVRLLAEGADAIGANGMGDKIRKGLTDGVRGAQIDIKAETKKLRLQLMDALNINAATTDMKIAYRQGKMGGPQAADDPVLPTGKPTGKKAATGPTDAELKAAAALQKKRISMAEELTQALEAAEAKIDKNEKTSLESRLSAIDVAYQKVFRKIEELAKLPGGAEQANQMKATLQSYVGQLKAQEAIKFEQEQNKKNLADIKAEETRINELIALRTQLLANVAVQQKLGNVTPQEGQAAVAKIDAMYVPQINQAVTATMALAEANKAAFGDTLAFDNFQAKLAAIPDSLKKVQDDLITTGQVNDKIAGGLTNVFESFAQAIANGQNAMSALKDAFLQFAAQFLREIAMMILKQLIFNAISNSSIGGMIGGAASAAVKHDGGIIGKSGGVSRSVSNGVFAGAPVYHTGGIAGLAADEYPAILQRNEEILTKTDPRNILNGGAAAGGNNTQAPAPQSIQVINAIDSGSVMQAGLNTPEGTKAVVNYMRANRASVKQALGIT